MFDQLKGPNRSYKAALPGMRDHQMLANAARRSGNVRSEALMYHNQGILYDNVADWKNSIKCYKRFVRIARR